MSAVPPTPPHAPRRYLTPASAEQFFARQSSSFDQLPDPQALLDNLATGVVEVLGGVRDLEQLGRWLSEGVYRHLLRRSVIAARGRAARQQLPTRPVSTVVARRITRPADGVVEATLLLHGAVRTRAVAIRLEGLDSRWRATALAVL